MGSISTNKKTNTVAPTVMAGTDPGPQSRVASMVVSEAKAMWVMLVPMSMVISALSNRSAMRTACLARGTPFSA